MMEPDCHIRRAAANDAEFLRVLHQRAYAKYLERMNRVPEPMAANWQEILGEDAVWLAEMDGNPSGALVLRTRADHLLIWSVAVDPGLQGRGIGRQLLEFAELEAGRRGIGEIRLYTNETFTENIGLYEAIGYAVTHIESTRTHTLVHMRKRIGIRSSTPLHVSDTGKS